jgi:hypothetical protein
VHPNTYTSAGTYPQNFPNSSIVPLKRFNNSPRGSASDLAGRDLRFNAPSCTNVLAYRYVKNSDVVLLRQMAYQVEMDDRHANIFLALASFKLD